MRLRIPNVVSVVVATAALLALPAKAEAQGRAVVRVQVGVGAGVGVGVGGPRVYASPYGYRPYYYGYGYGPWFYGSWNYAYGPWFYGSWNYGYAPWYPPYYGYGYDTSASMRLQVSQRQTEVFIDGYFAGTVDDFDGMLQRLHLEPGDHDVELYLPGHRNFVQRIYLQPTKTFRIRHDMVPLAPGDPPAVRPDGEPLPERRSNDELPPRGAGPGRDRDRQPPPSARGRVTAAGFGSLALRVQPGDAQVLIDGEPWNGAAQDEPLVVQLGTGVHQLEIRKDGYRTYVTDVTVRPGETATLNVAMTRQ